MNNTSLEYSHNENDREILTLRFSFPRGIILPEQFLEIARLLHGVPEASVRLKPFHTLEIDMPAIYGSTPDLLRKTAEQLVVLTKHVHTPVMMPVGIDIWECGESCIRLAERLSSLIDYADMPYYEILRNEILLHVSDGNHHSRYHLLHKGIRMAIDPHPGYQTDFYAHDIGIVPVAIDHGIAHCRIFAGGGGGIEGGSPALAGRVASPLGICPPDHVEGLVQAILDIHRDHGDKRNPRKRRLKSLMAEYGSEWLLRQLANMGFSLPLGGKYEDHVPQYQGAGRCPWRYIPLPLSRMDSNFCAALANLSRTFKGYYQLISSNGLYIVSGGEESTEITRQLLSSGLREGTAMEERARACRGAPGCPKGKSASGSILPRTVRQLEEILQQVGLEGFPIVFRISGCPNGCSKPYFAELALVGRKENMYDVFAGGSPNGDRLAFSIRKRVKREDIMPFFSDLLQRFATERHKDEFFGDWALRIFETMP